jgi:hypothetical protein
LAEFVRELRAVERRGDALSAIQAIFAIALPFGIR